MVYARLCRRRAVQKALHRVQLFARRVLLDGSRRTRVRRQLRRRESSRPAGGSLW